jgi:hypothetical protein
MSRGKFGTTSNFKDYKQQSENFILLEEIKLSVLSYWKFAENFPMGLCRESSPSISVDID